jgi:hypothetical protein
MLQTNVVEKVKTHFVLKIKSCRLGGNVEKYCRAQQAERDNIAHVHCMLYNCVYKHTLRICNTCYFSTTTIAARTLLSVTLHVP